MNKKILISLSALAVVAVAAAGATVAYFSDVETSSGNILTAGTLDIKVDHLKQTYNDVDCNTCGVSIVSDTSNKVVAKNGEPNDPYNAVLVSWIHPAWTANIDGASWIWATNPTTSPEDTQNEVTYTFEKEFEWMGPANGVTLTLGVAADNTYSVVLNGTQILFDNGEFNYNASGQDSVALILDDDDLVQGTNTLDITVKNLSQVNGTSTTNPAGLLYKLEIDGECSDNYFKENCSLWASKDLDNEKFFQFDDIKPGDHGTNVISVHANGNDGWACLMVNGKADTESGELNGPEKNAGDVTANMGELSKFIKIFGWNDENNNGIYEPDDEDPLFDSSLESPVISTPIADATTGDPIDGNTTKYLGFAWCAGEQTVNGDGTITCDGSGVGNLAQTDAAVADLTIYAEQWRNNQQFKCESLAPNQLVNGGFEEGDLTGWNAPAGYSSVVSNYSNYGPVEGTKFLKLTAGLGTGVYTIASQNVTLKAGQKLQGWAAFDADDYLPFNDDAAVVVISGGDLDNAWSANVAGVGDYGQTPWQQWSWTAPADGTYTLELKVANQVDNLESSSALFDANIVLP